MNDRCECLLGRVVHFRARVAAGVVLLDGRGHGTLELGHGASNGLVGVGGELLDDHRLQAGQARFQRALDVIRIGLVVVGCVRHVGFHAGNVIAKAVQRFLDHGLEVFGHALAAVNMGIGLQQYLHVFLVMESGQFSVVPIVGHII